MIIRDNNLVRLALSAISIAAILIFNSCEPSFNDASIPPASFNDIYINLTLPKYQALRTDGGSMYLDGGVRGLIIYRVNASQYVAYERNCTFQPNEACATVEIHASRLYMEDPCCGSTFNFSTGQPMGGSAVRSLRRYYTSVNNLDLIVTDDIVN